MLSATQLKAEHDSDFDGRPQRIQRLRDEFATYCDLTVPRGVAAVEDWYRSKKSVITRRLNKKIDGGNS